MIQISSLQAVLISMMLSAIVDFAFTKSKSSSFYWALKNPYGIKIELSCLILSFLFGRIGLLILALVVSPQWGAYIQWGSLYGVLPVWVMVALFVLTTDFLRYFRHLLFHKVSYLWKFHKVHHQLEEFNVFAAIRVHPLELISKEIIRVSLILVFGIVITSLVGGFLTFLEFLSHGRARLNYGPLGKIFVSPDFHAIHHGVKPEFHNKNYGVYLVIWDYLFGTAINPQKCGSIADLQIGLPLERSLSGIADFMLRPFKVETVGDREPEALH